MHSRTSSRPSTFLLCPGAPARISVELAGPERFEFVELVRLYRRWLGLPLAVEFPVPRWLAALAYRSGDFAGRLGWRPPVRSTARLEVERGAVGDDSNWKRLTGSTQASFTDPRSPAGIRARSMVRCALFVETDRHLQPCDLLDRLGIGLSGPGLPSGMALLAQGGVTGPSAKLVIGAVT